MSDNPHVRIESIKSHTPPSAGDSFVHPVRGLVRLISPCGGDSWWARAGDGTRIPVRPSKLKRHHGEIPLPE